MFTGIIQCVGKWKSIKKSEGYASIQVSVSDDFLDDVAVGDSIAVNGVCLTVNKNSVGFFQTDVMKETLQKSNLGFISAGEDVNLEKAVRADSFLGGHIVQGHVDCTASIKEINPLVNQWVITFNVHYDIIKNLFPKASIAINGISLTVMDVSKDSFSVSIIPATFSSTNLMKLKKGSFVNVETDIIGKYVTNYLNNQRGAESITKGFLSEHGF